MLQSMGSQKVGHDRATELNWSSTSEMLIISTSFSKPRLNISGKEMVVFIQTGSYHLDEDFAFREVSPGLFTWWQKNSSYPVTARLFSFV